MSDPAPSSPSTEEIAELRARLQEAEDTLEAIRSGAVDALVVSADKGYQVYTLETADHAYRAVLNNMNEGVVTLTDNGTIVYCNRCFSRMARLGAGDIIGQPFNMFLSLDEAEEFQHLMQAAGLSPQVAEMNLLAGDGLLIPARLSVTMADVGQPMFSILISDLTEQKVAEMQLLERQSALRRLVTELTLTEERERRLLAAALHDSIGQTLAFMRMRLCAARSGVTQAPLEAELREVDELLVKTIAETRSLTMEISPPMLYQLGLEAAVRWLADDMQEKYDFSIRFDGAEQLHPLDDDARAILYQTVRELLTNAAKHAAATEVAISVTREPQLLVIEVADDGQGFDLDAYHADATSFGLFSIRERLEDMAGSLKIESSPGAGSRFTVTMPLVPADV